MLSRDDGDCLRWQEERVLRPQLRGRFRDVCEAVAELRKKDDPGQFLGRESQESATGLLLPPSPMGR